MPPKYQNEFKGNSSSKTNQNSSRISTSLVSNMAEPNRSNTPTSKIENTLSNNSAHNGSNGVGKNDVSSSSIAPLPPSAMIGQRLNDNIGTGISMATSYYVINSKPALNNNPKKFITSPNTIKSAAHFTNSPSANSHSTTNSHMSKTNFNNDSNKEKYVYKVNNDEFPALSDSNIPTETSTHNKNPVNKTSDNFGSYSYDNESSLCDYFYMIRNPYGNTSDIFNAPTTHFNEMKRYFSLPNVEIPDKTYSLLEETVAAITSSMDASINQVIEKDSSHFFQSIKKKKHSNGLGSISKMFPLIEQVKMAYPYSKYSVGASVDISPNVIHYATKESDSLATYILPLLESCPMTVLYRVRKHLDDYPVPLDYLTLAKCHEKRSFTCDKYSDEILLFLYYAHVGDGLQMLAAYHLHRRGWRYHLVKRQWITLTNEQYKSYSQLINSDTSSSSLVTDVFWLFNVYRWRMEKIETTLDFQLFESLDVYAEFLHEATNSHHQNGQQSNTKSPPVTATSSLSPLSATNNTTINSSGNVKNSKTNNDIN